MSICELHVSYNERTSILARDGPLTISSGKDVAKIIRPLVEAEAVEVGYLLCLTAKNGLIGYHFLSRGCLDSTPMHPREIFKVALLSNANAIVLSHNHPSGDPTPSHDDVDLTRRIGDAGNLMGVPLLDHVIIGHQGRFISFKEIGRL